MAENGLSLSRIGTQAPGLFDREVHFKDGEWKKGQLAFIGKIVRFLNPQAKQEHREQLLIDHQQALKAREEGYEVRTSGIRTGKPLTDREVRKTVPDPDRAKTMNVSKGLDIARQLTEKSGARLTPHFEKQALEQFTRALGQSEALLGNDEIRQLWDSTVEHYSGLEREDLRNQAPELSKLIGSGGGVYRDHIDPNFEPTISPATFSGAIETISRVRSEAERDILMGSLTELGVTYELTGLAPCGLEEVEGMLSELDEEKKLLESNLEKLQHMAKFSKDPAVKELAAALMVDVEAQIQSLDEHAAYLQTFRDGDPLSDGAIDHANKLWYDSGVRLLTQQIEDPNTTDDQRAVLLKSLQDLMVEGSEPAPEQQRPGTLDSTDKKTIEKTLKPLVRETPKLVLDSIKEAMKEAGIEFDEKGLEKQLDRLHKDSLNNGQEWGTIEKELRFRLNGVTQKAQSTITPGCDMEKLFPNQYAPGTGVNCAETKEDKHSVNLARTELSLPDENGEMQTVFTGIRHGVHCAFGLPEGSEEREQANINRATESVIAALSLYPELLQKALGGETVGLSIGSLSLMTPDEIREILPGFQDSHEKTFTREQLETWDKLESQQPLEIKVRDPNTGEEKTVKINLDVMSFSFGVNEGAVVGKYGLGSETIGGWGNVRDRNESSLTKLIGDLDGEPGQFGGKLGAYLAREDISPQERQNALDLARQIRQMWQDGSYMHQGNDPYKMGARIAVLCDLIGTAPLWNCKSGKDRTGMLDGEAKFLAARMHLTGQVPEPDPELTEEEKVMYQQFILRSGNHEMQVLNTGLAGFKTEGVSSIDVRLGDPKAREIQRGASAAVKE